MINLRHVKSLIGVVEAGTVNRASEKLSLAPSSVSTQLRELSNTLGVDLFESSGRRIVLNSAGRQLLPMLKQLLILNDEIKDTAQALVKEPAGELRLFAPSSMCIYRLPGLIEVLQVKAPSVELHLQHDPFDYHQGLAERSIDAAIVITDDTEPGYTHKDISSEEVIFVGHPDIIKNRRQSPTQLNNCSLITTEPGCSYRVAAEKHFKQCGLRLTPRQCFSNVEVIRRCLLAKMGIGLLPRCVVDEDLVAGRLKEQRVTGTPYYLKSTLIWPQEANTSPNLGAFLEAINDYQA